MDLSDPMSSVVPSLDGAVLRVLNGTIAPLSGSEIHRLCRRGSYAGVQKVLGRLCDQGLVRRNSAGRVGQFVGNRAHLAWPAVEILVNISNSLVERISNEIASWRVSPVAAFLFGSTARGDGDQESDIDVWLVSHAVEGALVEQWDDQSFHLSVEIRDWTGNSASILESSLDDVTSMVRDKVPFLDELRRDGIALTGMSLRELLRAAR
jgi:predicted nucleotidyltransferase